MKKLLIFGIVIVVLVAAYFTLYFIDVSGQILEVSRPKVLVKKHGGTKLYRKRTHTKRNRFRTSERHCKSSINIDV